MEKTNGKLFYGWVVVIAAAAVLFFGFCAGFYSFSVFLEPFQKTFGWSKSQVSLGMTIAALVVGLLSPVVGALVKRYGAKKVQLIGAVILGLGLLLASYMQTLLQLYLVCTFIGIGVATAGQIPAQTLATHWFSERRGTAMGIVVMSIGLGAMFMVWFAGNLVAAFGWRMAYRVLALLVLVFVVPLIIFIIKNKPEEMGLVPDGVTASSSASTVSGVVTVQEVAFTLKEAVKTLPYSLIALSYFLFAVILGALNVHAISLFHSFGIAQAATAWSLALGVSVVGRILFGYLADKYSKKNLVLASWVLQICAMGALMLIVGSSQYLWAFIICYGLGMGAFNTLLPLFVSEKFGAENFSQLIGVVMLCNIIGIAVGSIAMGHLYDASDSYHSGVTMILIVSVLGILSTFITGTPNKKISVKDEVPIND